MNVRVSFVLNLWVGKSEIWIQLNQNKYILDLMLYCDYKEARLLNMCLFILGRHFYWKYLFEDIAWVQLVLWILFSLNEAKHSLVQVWASFCGFWWTFCFKSLLLFFSWKVFFVIRSHPMCCVVLCWGLGFLRNLNLCGPCWTGICFVLGIKE